MKRLFRTIADRILIFLYPGFLCYYFGIGMLISSSHFAMSDPNAPKDSYIVFYIAIIAAILIGIIIFYYIISGKLPDENQDKAFLNIFDGPLTYLIFIVGLLSCMIYYIS